MKKKDGKRQEEKKEQRGQRRKQKKEEKEEEKEEEGNDKLLIGERGRKEGRETWIKFMTMKQTNAKVFLFSQTLK